MGELSQRSQRDRITGAVTATVSVILGVWVPVLVSQFLPSADAFGAGMSERMVGDVIRITGLLTVGLAVVVGVLWYAVSWSAWGRAATILIAVFGVAAMLFFSWNACLIPNEYCSAIP
jgi:hypothetical protein